MRGEDDDRVMPAKGERLTPAEVDLMGRQARVRAARYTVDRMAAGILEIYRGVSPQLTSLELTGREAAA